MTKLAALLCLVCLTTGCVGPTTARRLTSGIAAPLDTISILRQRVQYRISCTFVESCEVEAHRVCPAGYRDVNGPRSSAAPNATASNDAAAHPGPSAPSSWWFVQHRSSMLVECF